MLDTSTGELHIESVPMKLGPQFTRRALSSTPVAATSQVVNEPYHSYSLGEQRIADEPFFVVLYFYGQLLESIDLAYSAENDERRRKKWHDKWLHGQTGAPSHVYAWGEVSSDFDPRSGGSSIIIRYSWQGRAWPGQDAT